MKVNQGAVWSGISISALLLAACATHEVDFQGEGEGFVGPGAEVQAVLETPSVGTAGQDAADDPAVCRRCRRTIVRSLLL